MKQSKRVEKNVIQQNILTKIEQRKGKIRYRNTKPNKEESEALKHVRKQDKKKSTKSDGRNSLSIRYIAKLHKARQTQTLILEEALCVLP